MALKGIARRRWARSALEGVLVLALFLGVRAYTLRGVASGGAPPLVGRDLRGQRVSLDDWRGEAVAVHFWATWCPVCNAESGSIAGFARNGRVVTVATSSGEAAAIHAKMDKAGVAFPVVVDADGAIAAAWGVTRFPTTFFLNREHRVSTVESGYTTSLGLRARLVWAGL
jgi:thiol-disulfide isomerase/thioredoxin